MGISVNRGKRFWRPLLLVAIATGTLVFVAAAQAAFVFSPSGTSFTATLTNDTSDPVINVTMAITKGTPSVANDIDSLNVTGGGPGAYCVAMGQAQCNQMNLAPGANASFRGTTSDTITQNEVFQGCIYTYNSSTQATTCHQYAVKAEVPAGAKVLRVNFHNRRFVPTHPTVAWNATVTICNQDPVYAYPFTLSPGAAYTTLVHERDPAAPSGSAWYLAVPIHNNQRTLAPAGHSNACGTFRVRNTSGRVLTVEFFDHIYHRARTSLTIEPKPGSA